MECIRAKREDIPLVAEIARQAMQRTYPLYYPPKAVEFFLWWHSAGRIEEQFLEDEIYLLLQDGKAVGTGSRTGCHIHRVFVLPEQQGKGYGSAILRVLESRIFDEDPTGYPEIILEAVLSSYGMYRRRGYEAVGFEARPVEGGEYLCYHVMKKARPPQRDNR